MAISEIKAKLNAIKEARKSENKAVIAIRLNSKIRDSLLKKLTKDGLTYKDLFVTAAKDYLGDDYPL